MTPPKRQNEQHGVDKAERKITRKRSGILQIMDLGEIGFFNISQHL